MPYFESNGVTIHYEVEGTGPPVILHHGGTSNLESWRQAGVIDALSTNYQTIAIDARGHGLSEKLTTPARYSHQLMAEDVINLLDILDITSVHYYGYSLGGHVGMFLNQHYQHRMRSLILAAAQPVSFSGVALEVVESILEGLSIAAKSGGAGYVAHMKRNGAEMLPFQEARYLATEQTTYQAQYAAVTSILNTPHDYSESLRNTELPTLILVGNKDELQQDLVKNGAEAFPNARFEIIFGANHASVYGEEASKALVSEFLSAIT